MFAHERYDFGVLARDRDRLAGLPLGVVDHLSAVKIHVQVGGDEPGHLPYGLVRRAHKVAQQRLGAFGLDRIRVDDRHVAGSWIERCEARPGFWRATCCGEVLLTAVIVELLRRLFAFWYAAFATHL